MRALWMMRLVTIALVACVVVGCAEPRTAGLEGEDPHGSAPSAALIHEIKTFERRIGFAATKNFLRYSSEKKSFPFCGFASRFYLPYSYEDPAIRWITPSDRECSGLDETLDVFAGESEAIGERDTPVTPSMLRAPLERMLYIVIHEDCHDQFAFPHGIEEALCEVIAHEAMLMFSSRRYGAEAPESWAAQRYAREASRQARLTVAFYGELAALYARHERSRISRASLLGQRAGIFKNAARALGWDVGVINNVFFANAMTYSRHHAFLIDAFDALGRDLPQAVAFFRRVDAIKPSAGEIMKAHGLATDSSLEFVRAYEAAVVETTTKALAGWISSAQTASGAAP